MCLANISFARCPGWQAGPIHPATSKACDLFEVKHRTTRSNLAPTHCSRLGPQSSGVEPRWVWLQGHVSAFSLWSVLHGPSHVSGIVSDGLLGSSHLSSSEPDLLALQAACQDPHGSTRSRSRAQVRCTSSAWHFRLIWPGRGHSKNEENAYEAPGVLKATKDQSGTTCEPRNRGKHKSWTLS